MDVMIAILLVLALWGLGDIANRLGKITRILEEDIKERRKPKQTYTLDDVVRKLDKLSTLYSLDDIYLRLDVLTDRQNGIYSIDDVHTELVSIKQQTEAIELNTRGFD